MFLTFCFLAFLFKFIPAVEAGVSAVGLLFTADIGQIYFPQLNHIHEVSVNFVLGHKRRNLTGKANHFNNNN